MKRDSDVKVNHYSVDEDRCIEYGLNNLSTLVLLWIQTAIK